MSSATTPIDASRFAAALRELALDALYSKAAELQNNLIHLRSSNEQMKPYADEGDIDCREAISENYGVIDRLHERMLLLKVEVERRGMTWVESEASVALRETEMRHLTGDNDGDGIPAATSDVRDGLANAHVDESGTTARNVHVNGSGMPTTNGNVDGNGIPVATTERIGGQQPASSGRLTDEELRRRLEAQLAAEGSDDSDGVHL